MNPVCLLTLVVELHLQAEKYFYRNTWQQLTKTYSVTQSDAN